MEGVVMSTYTERQGERGPEHARVSGQLAEAPRAQEIAMRMLMAGGRSCRSPRRK